MKKLNYQVYEGNPPEDQSDKNNLYIEGDIENGVIKNIKSIKMSNGNEVIDFPVSPSVVLDFNEITDSVLELEVRYTKAEMAGFLGIEGDDLDKLERGEYIFARCYMGTSKTTLTAYGPVESVDSSNGLIATLPQPNSVMFAYNIYKEGDKYYIPV